MKTDPKALFWGTVVGLGIVIGGCIIAFDFPDFRFPFTDAQAVIFLVTALLYGMLIASYRKLWGKVGFWALLLAFLGAHAALYLLVVVKIAEEVRGLQMDALYGIMGGAEFFAFAMVVLRLFHRGPDARSWTGRNVR